jgi:uncharacterized protein (TIGR03382 family)
MTTIWVMVALAATGETGDTGASVAPPEDTAAPATTTPPATEPTVPAPNDTGVARVSAAELSGEVGGCGCASGGATGAWVGVSVLLLWRRR